MCSLRRPCAPMLLTLIVCVVAMATTLASKSDEPLLKTRRIKHPASRTPGCWLGKNFYQPDETWHPVIAPYGEVYCLNCTCIPVIDKRGRLSKKGRITCENVASKCPKIDCPNAVRKPKQCCKYCPTPGKKMREFQVRGRDERLMQQDIKMQALGVKVDSGQVEFTSYLRAVDGLTQSQGVGRAHLLLVKNALHYSIHTEKLELPFVLQIVDEHRRLLYDRTIHSLSSEKSICGVWKDIPDLYLRYLNEQKLQIRIATVLAENGQVYGAIAKMESVVDGVELLSSVLQSLSSFVGSGVAMFWLPEDNAKDLAFKILFHIDLNRLTSDKQLLRISIVNDQQQVLRSITETVNLNDGQISSQFDNVHRYANLLAAGKLFLRLSADSSPSQALLSGPIKAKASCDVYAALLSTAGLPKKRRQSAVAASATGYLTLSMHGNAAGRVSGRIVLPTADTELTKFALTRKRRRNVLLSLLNGVVANPAQSTLLVNQSIGEEFFTLKNLHRLFTGQIYVHLCTSTYPDGLLQSRLVPLPFDDLINYERDVPTLLRPVDGHISPANGLFYYQFDVKCHMHYNLLTQGLAEDVANASSKLQNNIVLSCPYTEGNSTSVETKSIAWYRGLRISGVFKDVGINCFRAMNNGQAQLLIKTLLRTQGEVIANLNRSTGCASRLLRMQQQDNAPSSSELDSPDPDYYDATDEYADRSAVQHTADSENRVLSLLRQAQFVNQRQYHRSMLLDAAPKATGQTDSESDKSQQGCLVSDEFVFVSRVIPEGGLLIPEKGDTCRTCFCKGNQLQCFDMECPVPTCNAPLLLAGHCCPVCNEASGSIEGNFNFKLPSASSTTAPVGCRFGGHRLYPVGARFHPFFYPTGFQRCLTCTCLGIDKVTCQRTECPPLRCTAAQTHRPTDVCCPSCADTNSPKPLIAEHHRAKEPPMKQLMRTSEQNQTCQFQGQTYRINERWTVKMDMLKLCIECNCQLSALFPLARCSKSAQPYDQCS